MAVFASYDTLLISRSYTTSVDSTATPEGYLPEQVQDHVQSPYMLAHWRQKWGATATPLLWSHAMHVVLTDELNPSQSS